MDIKSLHTYITTNTIETKEGRKCVDGRYQQNTLDSGMIARPGADLGYVMALLSLSESKNLKLTPEEYFESVFNALQKLGETFYLHTDHHADPNSDKLSENSIGCGHAAKPMNSDLSKAYLLNSEEEQKLVQYAKKKAHEDTKKIRIVNLEGDHKEQGVLVVTSKERTVNNFDGSTMFFLYDKTRDEEFIEKLVPLLSLPTITIEEFKSVLKKQTNATLELLAKGLPIYEVNGELRLEVKQIGTL